MWGNRTESKLPHITRERILDAAEQLFMERGFEATSLRLITTKAEVNLAAVNYHFGSKDALVEAVFRRRLAVLNRQRLEVLDALEQQAGTAPLTPSQIIKAFFSVTLRMSKDTLHGGNTFIRLLGRAYTEPNEHVRNFLATEYAPVIARYKAALVRALPQMPEQELVWRMHFCFGAMSYTIAGTDALQLIAAEPEQAEDVDHILARLVPFLVAGLLAPLPEQSHTAASKKPKPAPVFKAA